jgi:hypothetical protein
LISAIDDFLKANPNSNLINIAKSKDFTAYLFSCVNKKYKVEI